MNLRQYRNRLRNAEYDLDQYLRRVYAPGETIRWEYGGRVFVGSVVRNGFGARVKVENGITGKQRWVHSGSIWEG